MHSYDLTQQELSFLILLLSKIKSNEAHYIVNQKFLLDEAAGERFSFLEVAVIQESILNKLKKEPDNVVFEREILATFDCPLDKNKKH